MRLLRITAVGAAVASIATFSLSVALLAAGSSPSTANDDYWVAVSAAPALFTEADTTSRLTTDPKAQYFWRRIKLGDNWASGFIFE